MEAVVVMAEAVVAVAVMAEVVAAAEAGVKPVEEGTENLETAGKSRGAPKP